MTTYYISPSYLSYMHYRLLIRTCRDMGWSPTFHWPQEAFAEMVPVDYKLASKVISAIAKADIFIAPLPGTPSTYVEAGLAYMLCEELVMVAKDPVYFAQTNLADTQLCQLPSIKRVCCAIDEIPTMLKKEYLYLIEKN